MASLDDFDPDEFYRTTDMGLAAFLKLQGHEPQKVLWAADSCYWIFRVNDGLLDASDLYLEGGASVEPRAYNGIFGATKKEFYRISDAHRGMEPRRVTSGRS